MPYVGHGAERTVQLCERVLLLGRHFFAVGGSRNNAFNLFSEGICCSLKALQGPTQVRAGVLELSNQRLAFASRLLANCESHIESEGC